MALDKRMTCCSTYQTILWANSGWPHLGVSSLTLKEEGWARSNDAGASPDSRGWIAWSGVSLCLDWSLQPMSMVFGEDTALVQLCARSTAHDLRLFLQISFWDRGLNSQLFPCGWHHLFSLLLDLFPTLPKMIFKNQIAILQTSWRASLRLVALTRDT